jgi:hypothetical protein
MGRGTVVLPIVDMFLSEKVVDGRLVMPKASARSVGLDPAPASWST